MQPEIRRYSTLMIILHWSTALVVLIAYVLSESGPSLRTHPPLMHFSFGLSVMMLLVARLIARALPGAVPVDRSTRSAWLARMTSMARGALYLLMIGVPVSGWYVASRMGLPADLFGMTLPALTGAVEGSPGWVAGLHKLGGNSVLILAALHASVALWHHFIMRDDTLRRMSPF